MKARKAQSFPGFFVGSKVPRGPTRSYPVTRTSSGFQRDQVRNDWDASHPAIILKFEDDRP